MSPQSKSFWTAYAVNMAVSFRSEEYNEAVFCVWGFFFLFPFWTLLTHAKSSVHTDQMKQSFRSFDFNVHLTILLTFQCSLPAYSCRSYYSELIVQGEQRLRKTQTWNVKEEKSVSKLRDKLLEEWVFCFPKWLPFTYIFIPSFIPFFLPTGDPEVYILLFSSVYPRNSPVW